MRVLRSRVLAVLSIAGLVFGVTGVALATTGAAKPASYTGCVTKAHVLKTIYAGSHACPPGQTRDVWNKTGPAGPQGPRGRRGATGPATVTATAVTNMVTAPLDGAGGVWAKAGYSLQTTVTRQGAAPGADCGSTATACWFYTGTVFVSGTYTSLAGAETPNQDCTEPGGQSCSGLTISNIVGGGLDGGGDVEFYASTDAPDATLVPVSHVGVSPENTDTWYEQFFPAGTAFGLTSAPDAPWVAYRITYVAPSTCETWEQANTDNAGDGTYSAAGNVSGINQCSG